MDTYDLNDAEGRLQFADRVRAVAATARTLADGLEEIANITARNDTAHILALEAIGEIVAGAEDWPLVRGDAVLAWTKKHTPDNPRSLSTDLTNDEIERVIAGLQGNPDGMRAAFRKLATQKRGT